MTDRREAEAETFRAEMRARIEEARVCHDRAQKIFRRFISGLEDVTDKLEDGTLVSNGEVKASVKDFSLTLMYASQEAYRYEKSVLENTGLIADAPIDLDAIRSEIGSRLDRLRASG